MTRQKQRRLTTSQRGLVGSLIGLSAQVKDHIGVACLLIRVARIVCKKERRRTMIFKFR